MPTNFLSADAECTLYIQSIFFISYSSKDWIDWFLLHKFIFFLLLILFLANFLWNRMLRLLSTNFFLYHPVFCLSSNLFFCLLILDTHFHVLSDASRKRKKKLKCYAYLWHFWNLLFCSHLQSLLAHYYTFPHILQCHIRPQFAQLLSSYYVLFSYTIVHSFLFYSRYFPLVCHTIKSVRYLLSVCISIYPSSFCFFSYTERKIYENKTPSVSEWDFRELNFYEKNKIDQDFKLRYAFLFMPLQDDNHNLHFFW